MRLEGKVALVSGAAGLMGSAVSRAFASEGARLFLSGRTKSKIDALADEIRAGGGHAEAAEVDGDHRDQVEARFPPP